ncbi:MAG: sarcosine oxidase subunit gamma family protein [Caulobacteraceae bacterium]
MVARARPDLQIASVIARRGMADALAARVKALFALDLPAGPSRADGVGVAFLGVGPDRWLAVRTGGGELAAELARDLAGLASVSDQSDGYAAVELGGSDARRALAKGVPLDLHPAAFAPNDVAVTLIAHVGAVVWRADDAFLVAVFRSYAGSFWGWLAQSAAEFGLEVV